MGGRYLVLAISLVAGCGRIGFDEDPCAGESCELGPWSAPGGGHGFDATVRLRWGSLSGGGISNAGLGRARAVYIGVDGAGSPTAAYALDEGDGTHLYVRRFDGADWPLELPLLLLDDSSADRPGLAFAGATPLVAWIAQVGMNEELRVRRWSGSTWVDVGASPTGLLTSVRGADEGFSLAVDPGGAPIVAWQADSGALYVRRFDGNAWTAMGAGADTGIGLGTSTTLVMIGGATPTIAWSDAGNLYLRQWDGAQWRELGGSATTRLNLGTASAYNLRIAVDGQGRPIVAWSAFDTAADHDRVYARAWTGTAWAELGAGSATGSIGLSGDTIGSLADLAATDSGLMLAWTDMSGNEMYRRWTGSTTAGTWAPAAAGPFGYRAETVRIAIGPTGRSCTSASSPMAPGDTFVACTDATGAWVELGVNQPAVQSISSSPDASTHVSLAMGDSEMEASWSETRPGTSLIYARSFVDGAWRERAPGAASAMGVAGEIDVTDPVSLSGDRHYVFWSAYSACLMARVWDGTSWAEVTPGSAGGSCGIDRGEAADIRDVTGTVDLEGYPWVAFQDHCNDWNVFVMRWTGAAWGVVGPTFCDTNGVSDLKTATAPSLRFDAQGRAVIAYHGRTTTGAPTEVYARRWNGAAWEDLAGSSTGGGVSQSGVAATDPAITVDGEDRPWIAWVDQTLGTPRIYVRYFDGQTWLGAEGSDRDTGIADNAGPHAEPTIVTDPAGHPIVVWADASSGTWEIYARRWTGRVWQELSGSAHAGGISNSTAPSGRPSAAIIGSRLCIAWDEPDRDSSEIRARCLDVSR